MEDDVEENMEEKAEEEVVITYNLFLLLRAPNNTRQVL